MALNDAISFNHVDVVKSILQKDLNCINNPSWHGITPLHQAVIKGNLELIDVLLSYGANVNARNNFNETPLHCAFHSSPLRVVQKLLDHGADIRAVDDAGRTCVHHAARSGCVLKLCYLEALGVDVKQKDERGQSIFHIAGDTGVLDVLEFCLRKKRFDPRETDNYGMTPLHTAARQGNRHSAWLIESSTVHSLCDIQDLEGKTAVDYATKGSTKNHVWLARNLQYWQSSRCPPNKPPAPWLPWTLLLLAPSLAVVVLYVIQSNLTSVFMSRLATLLFVIMFYCWAFTNHRMRHISGWQSPTFCGFFFGMMAHSLICYSFYLLPRLWPEIFWTLIALITGIIASVLIKKVYEDPGISKSSKTDDQGKSMTAIDVAMGHVPEESFCNDCEIVMDDYVKHCRLCEKCMVAIDHHCLFLMHCIAVNNHKAFVTFLFIVVTGNVLFFRASLTYLFAEAALLDKGLKDVMATEVWLTILFVFNVGGCFWILSIMLYQLKMVSEGATTFYFPNGETKHGIDVKSDLMNLSRVSMGQRLLNIILFFTGDYNFYKNVKRKSHIV